MSVESFDKSYADICQRLKIAAEKSSRSFENIILLAATKTVAPEMINYAITKGIKYIGENRVQELLQKEKDILPVTRHFIGHLQTNKVKDIIDKVDMIHSVDSLKLANEISRQAIKKNKNIDVLLEVNIANEASKWGFAPSEVSEYVEKIATLDNISVKGLMAIPPVCNSGEENRKYFCEMYKLFIDIRTKKIDNSSMDILSMGMSDDFDIAVEEGANLVRLGTALFGRRL
ncbi:MAG: YggS family pyridoxal phosphate-dependent enzyme [Clostridia bacterium]|nr:YggS family pyridoxal phosphate-dependent enzyme [Clostridia bacterium]